MAFSESTVAARRRAVGVKLVNVANLLDSLYTANTGTAFKDDTHDDLQFLTEKELQALEKVREAFQKCEGNLRVVARHLGIES